jgi:hypothetical protein
MVEAHYFAPAMLYRVFRTLTVKSYSSLQIVFHEIPPGKPLANIFYCVSIFTNREIISLVDLYDYKMINKTFFLSSSTTKRLKLYY